ncbi:hypothetical protein SDC9_135885 [bioreactor metagenome]|uniref:Uncharacterized protein n=1 Tax=bioreactor metagenome TaxID=1076179 RepID=A0A645DHR5_9ZZZZ
MAGESLLSDQDVIENQAVDIRIPVDGSRLDEEDHPLLHWTALLLQKVCPFARCNHHQLIELMAVQREGYFRVSMQDLERQAIIPEEH